MIQFSYMNLESPTAEQEVRKQAWLTELSQFVVRANLATWAGEGKEVPAQRPGYKELQYPPPDGLQGDWLLRDSYTGYFRAPGMTTVYYKGEPAWIMQYGGHGQTEGYEDRAKATFAFLKEALKRVTLELPFRGPRELVIDDKRYEFEILEGTIEDGLWRERITEGGKLTFTQTGIVGIVVNKDQNRQPIYPWNR